MIESILEILNNCKIKSIETSLLISDFPEFPNKHLIIPSLNDLASKLLPTTLLFLLSHHHRSLYWKESLLNRSEVSMATKSSDEHSLCLEYACSHASQQEADSAFCFPRFLRCGHERTCRMRYSHVFTRRCFLLWSNVVWSWSKDKCSMVCSWLERTSKYLEIDRIQFENQLL